MTGQKAASIGFSLRSVREIRARDLAIRLTFGATMSGVAAVAAIVVGPRFGGLFLAFPAILPATLTLIEKQEHKNEAKDDDVGAILGATALVPFGFLGWLLLPRLGAPSRSFDRSRRMAPERDRPLPRPSGDCRALAVLTRMSEDRADDIAPIPKATQEKRTLNWCKAPDGGVWSDREGRR